MSKKMLELRIDKSIFSYFPPIRMRSRYILWLVTRDNEVPCNCCLKWFQIGMILIIPTALKKVVSVSEELI